MKSMMLSAAVALLLLAGCATVDQKISLDYRQVDRSFGRHLAPITLARTVSKPAPRNERGDWMVGELNNANGVLQAHILADRSVEEWITEALQLELQLLGYTVSYRAPLPADVQYGVNLSNISNTLEINQGIVTDDARHELKFSIDLYSRGARVKSFVVSSKDTTTVPLSASREELEKIMRSSLQDAMLQIIPEIIKLTEAK